MSNMVFDKGGVYISNLANNAEQLGIGQYRFPFNFELAGKNFTIKAEDGEYDISFICGRELEFRGKKYLYECQKLEKTTYFILFSSIAGVVDLGQGYITLIDGDKYISGPVCPCAEGKNAPACAGDDMVGTYVSWILGCGRFMTQEFSAPGKCVVSWSPREGDRDELDCRATKIKGPIYLVDIRGPVRTGVCAPFFTDRVIMLQDYDHMMTVGCVMGKGFDPISVAGYAEFLN